jgi:hypothetical protein
MAKRKMTVDGYIAAKSEPVKETLEALRSLVKETLPEASEEMKWGAPVYCDPTGNALVYLYGGKQHAHLGFIHGTELDDPQHLLEGRGAAGRHVKLDQADHIPEGPLSALLKQCDETPPHV